MDANPDGMNTVHAFFALVVFFTVVGVIMATATGFETG